MGDEQLVEVRIARCSEECSRHHIRGHRSDRQRHRGLKSARINGAHDHRHVITAAAFLQQRFHVVGGAVGQRENGRDAGSDAAEADAVLVLARIWDGTRIGCVTARNQHFVRGVRSVGVHEQLAAVIAANVEAVKPVARRHEEAGETRPVEVQPGLRAERAGGKHVGVVGGVRQIVDEPRVGRQVFRQAARNVRPDFDIDCAAAAKSPRGERLHGVGGDHVARARHVAHAVHD